MTQDYGDASLLEADPSLEGSEERVRLERITFPEKLRGRVLAFHTSKYLAETRPIRGVSPASQRLATFSSKCSTTPTVRRDESCDRSLGQRGAALSRRPH